VSKISVINSLQRDSVDSKFFLYATENSETTSVCRRTLTCVDGCGGKLEKDHNFPRLLFPICPRPESSRGGTAPTISIAMRSSDLLVSPQLQLFVVMEDTSLGYCVAWLYANF